MEAEERIKQLKDGNAVVVNVRKEGGAYVDPVAKWAEENGRLTYCGDRSRAGHDRSKWFNPHHNKIKSQGRDWVCAQFESENLPHLNLLPLKGRALGCWCFPERCHCDVLAARVNGNIEGIGHNSGALEDIASRARLAIEQVEAGERLTIEGWLQYGAALNQGREMFPKGDNQRFSAWLSSHQLDGCNDMDRAAAMWAAANSKEFEATKEDNPRVRTVRGLHAKWKEQQNRFEQKCNDERLFCAETVQSRFATQSEAKSDIRRSPTKEEAEKIAKLKSLGERSEAERPNVERKLDQYRQKGINVDAVQSEKEREDEREAYRAQQKPLKEMAAEIAKILIDSRDYSFVAALAMAAYPREGELEHALNIIKGS